MRRRAAERLSAEANQCGDERAAERIAGTGGVDGIHLLCLQPVMRGAVAAALVAMRDETAVCAECDYDGCYAKLARECVQFRIAAFGECGRVHGCIGAALEQEREFGLVRCDDVG